MESQPYEITEVRWSCNVPEHKHKSKRTGDKCIVKMENPPVKAELLRRLAKLRRIKICAMFEEKGMTYKEIAAEIGVTPGRVRGIVIQEQYYRKYDYERL